MPHPEDNTAVDEIRGFEYGRGFKAAEAVAAPELQRLVDALAAMTADRDEARRTLNLVADELEAVNAAFAEYKRTHPDEDPDPDPVFDLEAAVQGTWVLQQVSSVGELTRLKSQILAALALPGVVGFSLRFPWNMADVTGSDNTHPLWVAGLAIAKEAGKAFATRFMAGRHTPARVFDAGAAYLTNGGQKSPVPWDNSSGKVQVFLDAYSAYAGKIAAWSRANDVHLLHGSWFALDWAELNHGKEVRAAEGYTEAKWLAGHKALITTLAAHRGTDLAVELPMSGYGPLSGGQSAALVDHVLSIVGPDSPEFFIQANGWGPNGEWGAPSQTVENDFDRIWSKPVKRGLQMIQPQDYDWAPVYARLPANKATYAEVYLPSFALAHKAQLEQEIAAFAKEN